MKKQVGLLLGLLTLSVGLSGANPIVIADDHDTPVANSSTEDEKQADRGIGYYWKCHTCGYHSEWHLFSGTAVSAANKHAQQYNHVTSVYPNEQAITLEWSGTKDE
ncbi:MULTISPECIES: hypothetical protein [unclassified Enterococcus]|uniref:hypothetical protein n=1 Tax=unclassified Enterococcus TaxID=2608891 RepID=UPI001A9AA41A|nr:hypothetical protein [Enterococcus sp. DIV1271a]MBO1299326.1 hypothetical protein [Enterococcus sp. DIV1271a]